MRFVVLIAIQVLILNHIQFSGFINPYLYVLFILLLPFETKGWVMLLSSFALGITIDLFSNSLGMHAFACVLMAFSRPAIVSLITQKTDFEPDTEPRISNMGAGWILMYTVMLVFIHHLALFLLEVFRFEEIPGTLTRTLFSAVFSVGLIMLAHFLMGNPHKSRPITR